MRWFFSGILIFVTVTAQAILGSYAGESLLSVDGGHAAGILQTHPSAASILTIAFVLIVGGFIAVAYRWRGYSSLALIHAGVWLTALAGRTGGFDEFIFQNAAVGAYVVECVIWSIVLPIIAAVLLRQPGGRELSDGEASSFSVFSAIGLLVCIAMTAVVVWLVARSQMKGQTLTAVIIASVLAGLFGSFLPTRRLQLLLLSIPPLVGAGGAAFAWWQHQSIALTDIGTGWSPLALPMPQDYAGGGLLGVALGIAWSHAFLSEDQKSSAPSAGDDALSHDSGAETAGNGSA